MGRPKVNLSRIRAVPINGVWTEEQCTYCPWLEWDDERGGCNNRGEFICWLYLSEVFGLRDT